ncbi:class I SAM-dependent methyltransferase [Alphaproteobacteria bacterium]|nr:class I SAM-dependent methyltransferase [Alphaproteobacteria bacterium]
MSLIENIKNNYKTPHHIPFKLIKKIEILIGKISYNYNFFFNKQNQIFDKLQLNRIVGLKKLNKIKKEYSFFDKRPMESEHEVLFSSISLSIKYNIKEILEIGTFDGVNAYLLSELFKNSNIETIDLETSKDDFTKYYNRKNINEFISKRNNILKKKRNIFFKEKNSIHNINNKKKYDLIWIDGAHGYPMISIDIINSINLINKNGLIICDDVFIKKIKSDKMYNSTAAFETLSELQKEKLINLTLIYKRLDPDSNSVEKYRQFIAIIEKNF